VGGEWLSFSFTEFCMFLDKLEAKRAQLWVPGAIEAHKYETERNAANVRVLQADEQRIRLQVTCKIDPQLYDYPLTLVTQVPAAWKQCRIVQEASKMAVPVVDRVVKYDALPGTELILIQSE
jgi:hypothetical protein